jgi:LysR family transcriptional regulator, nitrogen assimilation regulatory protein
MDLAKLEAFVCVAELGSLSKAAARYGLVPSALSRQLSALETECRGRLLHRTGRGVSLTELGERILPKARALLNDARSLEAEISESAGTVRGTVRIACLPSIASSLMTKVVSEARKALPDVIIHASEGLSGNIEQWLATGVCDLGFVLRKGAGCVFEQPVAKIQLCLVGPPGDPLTQDDTIPLARLAGVPVLQPGAPNAMRLSLEHTARQHGFSWNVVAEMESVALTKEMVIAGIGYGVLSMASVLPEIQRGRLSAARIVEPVLERPIYLSASSTRPSTVAVRHVSRLIREAAQELAPAMGWTFPAEGLDLAPEDGALDAD